MVQTALSIFLTFFGAIAAFLGSVAAALVLWLWVGAELFGKPLKINGAVGAINWSRRVRLALAIVLFVGLAALGVWLVLSDWPANVAAGILAFVPWWAMVAYLILVWLIVIGSLSRASGWPKLSNVYSRPRGEPLASKKLRWAMMGGGVKFENALTISAYSHGIGIAQNRFLAPFSRAILVPWSDVLVEQSETAGLPRAKLRFRAVDQVELHCLEECWEYILQHRPEN
ncbi:MAG: hypothetical protein ABJK59_11530 [Erythrobacter sp.]|uniref:hypothetical protein n=1 Tax=Erythrobacter sp. TaxID=1042 RepID=UPI003296E37B